MDFEEYWRNGCFGEYHDIYAKNLAEQFYNAGQQSKQAEIDALKEKILEIVDSYSTGSDTGDMGGDIKELLK